MPWTITALVALVILAPFLREALRGGVSSARKGLIEGSFARLSDGLTYYHWHGVATPHVIVLIHGLTTPHWVFSGLVRGLNLMGYQVLVYDLYGRGLSDRPRVPQTPQFFVNQLTELLDDQGLAGPVSLLGYSMGGSIATLYAATYPERVDRMILLAPAGIDYVPPQPLRFAGPTGFVGSWVWHLLGPRAIRSWARRDASGPTVIPDLEKRMRAEVARRGYLRSVLSAHRETLGIDMQDIHRDLGKTSIPALAIWGAEDQTIPFSAMGKLTQWNRNTRHHVVEGCGHALPHAAPNEIVTAITTFFREV